MPVTFINDDNGLCFADRSLKSCMLLLFSNDLDVLAVNKYQSRLDVDEIVQTMALLQRFL